MKELSGSEWVFLVISLSISVGLVVYFVKSIMSLLVGDEYVEFEGDGLDNNE